MVIMSRGLRRRNCARDGLARLSLRHRHRLRRRRSFGFTLVLLLAVFVLVGQAVTWRCRRRTRAPQASRLPRLGLMTMAMAWVCGRSRVTKNLTRRAVCGANRSRSSFSCDRLLLMIMTLTLACLYHGLFLVCIMDSWAQSDTVFIPLMFVYVYLNSS